VSKVRIRIDNEVHVDASTLDEEVINALKSAFTFDNPQYHLKRMLSLPGWWNEPKDVWTWRGDDKKRELIFPRGGLRKVRDVLEENRILYGMRDLRIEGGVVERYPKYIGPELRYYQEEAIEAAIKRENCVLRMPTGSGKSLMAIALASRVKLNTLVILPTVGLFKQWCNDAQSSLKMRPDELGVIHRKKRSLRPITATVQGTLSSQGIDEELKDFFGMIIVDECQKAPAKTYFQVIGAFPARYRIGISADERRKDKKEYLTNGLFGSVAYEKKRRDLETEGFIVDVEIRVVPTNFEASWYGLSQDVDDEKKLDFKRLLDEMVADEARNKLALKFAIEEARDEQVIMLSHRREHCMELDRAFVANRIRSGFLIGGDFEKEFDVTRAGILNGSIRVGVGTYGALGVGVNLPAVSVGVATTPIGGNRFNFNQVRGRLNRKSKGKTSSRLYVLWDRHVYPSHLRNIASWNPTVKVFDRGRWVEVRNYLQRMKREGIE